MFRNYRPFESDPAKSDSDSEPESGVDHDDDDFDPSDDDRIPATLSANPFAALLDS